MFRDNHHILFNRQEWSLRPEAKELRENKSLIVRMERQDHTDIHSYCPPVPLLGYFALGRTLREFQPGNSAVSSMENLMRSIEKSNKNPKAHPIEKELGNLAIWAIDLQRPFIAGVEQRQQRNYES